MAPPTSSDDADRRREDGPWREAAGRLKEMGYSGMTDERPMWRLAADAVMWLEDRVIRADPIEGRSKMRLATSPLEWINATQTYLERTGSPIELRREVPDTTEWDGRPGDDVVRVLLWLISYGIALEYEEHGERINQTLRSPISSAADRDRSTSIKRSTEFDQAHSKKTALDNTKANETEAVQHAIERLREVYIRDLKRLQVNVNKIIARAQEYTANPRTNTTARKAA